MRAETQSGGGNLMTKPLHIAHFELARVSPAFLVYRLENTGHCVMFPRDWFPREPPPDISIEIHDRQLNLLDAAEKARAQ